MNTSLDNIGFGDIVAALNNFKNNDMPKKKSSAQQRYEYITDKIIDLIENHQLQYDRPWITVGSDGLPAHNVCTGKNYRGFNQFILSMFMGGYPKNSWITFNQAKKLGGHIMKGEKAAPVHYFDTIYIPVNGKGKSISENAYKALSPDQKSNYESIGMIKSFSVFNVFQTKDLPEQFYSYEAIEPLPPVQRDAKAEALIKATDAKIVHKTQSRAFYSPSNDTITLPTLDQFKSTVGLYETALHELVHWTGVKKRLNREMGKKFGDKKYAAEELVAELGSALLCAELGFEQTISNNAAYLKSWLSALKQDAKFIVSVAGKAQKAADYIKHFSDVKELLSGAV